MRVDEATTQGGLLLGAPERAVDGEVVLGGALAGAKGDELVRAILAEKSRTGFRAEVKAILTAHGVKQLSDVKSPEEFAAIVAEAEVIGNG